MLYSRLAILATSERRCHNRRHPKPEQRLTGDQIGINRVGSGCAWWRHMIKESSPFVIIHDEQCPRPTRPIGYCMKGLRQERIAATNICVGMIVISSTVVSGGEARIQK